MNKDTPLPEIKKIHHVSHYVMSVVNAISIGGLMGVVIDRIRLGFDNAPGIMLTGVVVAVMLGLQVFLAMRQQWRSEKKAVSGFVYVGRTKSSLGYSFYLSYWPDIDDTMARGMEEAEKTLRRAMVNRKGYIAMSWRTKSRISTWLKMTPASDMSEDQARQVRQLICWRILRDNHYS